MSLRVWTARLAYDGDDRLDVSRAGNDHLGVRFAPSLALLRSALWQQKRGRWDRDAVARYMAEYRREMEAAQVCFDPWQTLLDRDELTICCYCPNAAACHRVTLAAMLVELGAAYEGER